MSKLKLRDPYASMSGKNSRNEAGYAYFRGGKQYYRNREENYQQKRSPKQKWNTSAFSYAHAQMLLINKDEEKQQSMIQAWKDVQKMLNGKQYVEARSWQFAVFVQEWKNEHPLEAWIEEYNEKLIAEVKQKTKAENTSDYMLQQQINKLQEQIDQLKERMGK